MQFVIYQYKRSESKYSIYFPRLAFSFLHLCRSAASV